VDNGCFLGRSPRPLIETLIRTAEQLVPRGGSYRGVVEAA